MSREFHLITYGLIIGYAVFSTWLIERYEGIVDEQESTLEVIMFSQGCLQPVSPDEA